MTNKQVQISGEDAAARFLELRGMRIIARNWRLRSGELDIVCLDGSTLVFVEVKARISDKMVQPSEAVDYPKQRKLRRLAEAFIAMRRPRFQDCRFDVVSVVLSGGRPAVTHIECAFF